MAENEVTIKISATDNFSSVLSKYQTAISGAESSTKDLGTASTNAQSPINSLASTITKVAAAYTAIKGLGVLVDFADLGENVNAATATFEALAGGASSAQAAMNLMREGTGGIVDDLTLMQNASRLFQMGLATSGEEAAKFSNMAAVLGRSMGKDTTQAFEDFSLMLANTSIPRLDTFGISAANVRARMNELSDEFPNMDRQSRFLQAVMEEGEKALANLGPAADVAITGLARWETAVENIKNNLAGVWADITNDAIGAVEKIADSMSRLGEAMSATIEPGQTQAAAEWENPMQPGTDLNEYNAQLSTLGTTWEKISKYSDTIGVTLSALGMDFNASQLESIALAIDKAGSTDLKTVIAELYQLDSALGGYAADHQEQFGAALTVIDAQITAEEQALAVAERRQQLESDALESADRRADITANIAQSEYDYQRALAETNLAAGADKAVRRREDNEAMWQAELAHAQHMTTLEGQRATLANAAAEAVERRTAMTVLEATSTRASSYASETGTQFGGLTLYSDEEMTKIRSMADEMKAAFEEASALHDQGIISDADYERAKNMADEVANLADEAERGAEAFANMNLSELLGQTGGGVMGEISDLVMEQLSAGGASEETIAAMQQQFDLASGRESELSVYMQDTMTPLLTQIAEEIGAPEAITAMQNVENAIREGRIEGMSTEQIIASLNLAAGYKVGEGGALESYMPTPAQMMMMQPGLSMNQMGGLVPGMPGALPPGVGVPVSGMGMPGQWMGPGMTPEMAGSMGMSGMGLTPPQLGEDAIKVVKPEAEDLLEALKSINEQSGEIGSNFAGFSDPIVEAQAFTEDLESTLDTLTATERQVKIIVSVEGDTTFLSLLGDIGLGTSVRNAGGSVPGADTRTTGKGGGSGGGRGR